MDEGGRDVVGKGRREGRQGMKGEESKGKMEGR